MAQAQQTDKDAASADQSGNVAGDPKSRDQKSRPSARADESEASQVIEVEQDPIAIFRSDHRKVEELFSSFDKASSLQEKARLTEQICTELMIHTLLEEELFYPACKGHMEERLLTEKAKAGGLDSPEARSFRVRPNIGTSFFPKEDPMARHSTSTMDRDDRGRFVSDDNDDRRTSRSRDDDYDDRRYDRPRDEEGRFTSA